MASVLADELREVEASERWRLHYSHEPVHIPQPAAGTAAVYIAPGTVEVDVLSVSFTFTAGAGVGNRIPFVRFLDPSGASVGTFGAPFLLVATNVARVSFGIGVAQFGANSAAIMGGGIPPVRLMDGMRLELGAAGILPADQISAAALFVRQSRVRD